VAPCSKLIEELHIVEDLAIVDNPQPAIGCRHRLMAAFEVNDRQASMCEA
jgi:hypothetical protein